MRRLLSIAPILLAPTLAFGQAYDGGALRDPSKDKTPQERAYTSFYNSTILGIGRTSQVATGASQVAASANSSITSGPYHGLAIQSRPPVVPDGGLATFAHLNDAGAPVQALVLPDGGVYDYLGIGGPIAPQSATRLVERPIGTDLDERGVNVKNFGACGDGGCDDTAAIQAAVNANSHILIPLGTFDVLTTITVPSGVTISGAGSGSIIRMTGPTWAPDAGGSNVGAFELADGTHDVTIRDLAFVGDNSPFVYWNNLQQAAIQIDGVTCHDITVERNLFKSQFAFPVHQYGEGLRTRVLNNTLIDCANGINISCDYGITAGNIITNSEGIEDLGEGHQILNNVLINVYNSGISVGGSGNVFEGMIVSGNIIDGTQSGGGILVSDGIYDALISNNTIRNISHGSHGIQATAGTFLDSERVTISNNSVTEPAYTDGGAQGGHGIYLDALISDYVLTGNEVHGATYGILVEGDGGAVMRGNRSSGNSTYDIGILNAGNVVLDSSNIYGTIQVMNSNFVTPSPGYAPTYDNGNVSGSVVNAFMAFGPQQKFTLAGNVTTMALQLSNGSHAPQGQDLTLIFVQDGSGSRTLGALTATNPSTTVKWAGGTTPTLSTAAGAVDVFRFRYDAAIGLYEVSRSMNVH